MSLRYSAQFTLQLRDACPRLFGLLSARISDGSGAYLGAAGDAMPPGLSRAVCLR